MGGRILGRLGAALLVVALASTAHAADPCTRYHYSGSVACASAPCYLPNETGAFFGDCGRVSVNFTLTNGTVSFDVEGRNEDGTFQNNGTITATTAPGQGVDIPFRYSRIKVTACTGDCTGTVSVQGW